jgi:L-alanine-DL-glutamate epimerase-like enolase superfamily enzyme
LKIRDVRTVLLTGPCTYDPYLSKARRLRSAAFIEICTDAGLVGLGETYAGYFCPELVPGVVEFFTPILLNQDVEDIPGLWDRMYHCGNYWCRTGLGLAVLNGIEAALWDLKGKLLGKPVYDLLGGCRHDGLRAYATGGPCNYPKDELAGKLDYYLSLGFTAVKIGAGSFTEESGFWVGQSPSEAADFEADKMQFVRPHVGPEVAIMIDGHMGNPPHARWDLLTATAVLQAVEPYDVLFFEEPLPYSDPQGYTELCRRSAVRVAGGECLTGMSEWRFFVERNCFDIGQPDGAFTGGLLEVISVAEILHSRQRSIATHAWGAAGALMQNIHCALACPNTIIVEVPPAFGPLHREILDDSFEMRAGRVLPPQKSGLGIELNERTKNRYPFVPGSGEFNSVPGKLLTN